MCAAEVEGDGGRLRAFDSNGFVTSDSYALGVSGVQQTYSFTRDPNSEQITAITDPLGRQFSYVSLLKTPNASKSLEFWDGQP